MTILFDTHSTSPVSNRFQIGKQVTITGTGIPVGGEIQFEVVSYEDVPLGNSTSLCSTSCSPGFPMQESVIVGTARIMCCDCSNANAEYPARLTADVPFVILDAPQKAWIRAVYSGPGIGTFTVAMESTDTQDITAAMRGCCNPPKVDLSVTKTVSNILPSIGEVVTYTVTTINAGPFPADGAVLQDVLPPQFTVSSITATLAGGVVAVTPSAMGLATGFVIPVFPVGGSVVLDIVGTFDSVGAVLNEVTITPPLGVVDINPGNNEAEVLLNVTENFVDLSVVKTASQYNALPGTPITYTIVVSNAGPKDANGTVVQDVLPVGSSASGLTTTYAGGAAGASPVIGTLQTGFTIATLPSGGSVTFVYQAEYATAGTYVNTATAVPPVGRVDTDTFNNISSVTTNIALNVVDLAVTKTQDANSYAIGDTVTYTVTAFNNGSTSADGAVLTDVIPSQLSSVVVSALFYGGAVSTGGITDVTLPLGAVIDTFPAGASVVVTITGVVSTQGTILNTVTITPPPLSIDVYTPDNVATTVLYVLGDQPLVCGGGTLAPTDTVFVVGSLKKCGGADLACGDTVALCSDIPAITSNQVRYSDPSSTFGAALCIDVGTFVPGGTNRVVYDAHTASFLEGSWLYAIGYPLPTRLTAVITNPSATASQLVVVELKGQDNIRPRSGVTTLSGPTASFIHLLTTDINAIPPGTGGYYNPSVDNCSWNQVVAIENSDPLSGGIGTFATDTASPAKLVFTLAPSASVTVYGKWWMVWDLNYPANVAVSGLTIHAGSKLTYMMYEGGAIV